jgi:hypothetical protein
VGVVIFALLKPMCKNTEKFMPGKNKCFNCEKDITSINNTNLAFPSKCFDCEKNSKTPWLELPSKCFDCEKSFCREIKKTDNVFNTYNRNNFLFRK